jgi:hypothetical protein
MEQFSFSFIDQSAGEGSLDGALVTARWALWHVRCRLDHGSNAARRVNGAGRRSMSCAEDKQHHSEGEGGGGNP